MKWFYDRQYASNYDELISYYPRYYRDVREMVAILQADGKLLDGAQDAIEQVYNNNFIDYMDEQTVKVFESLLCIKQRKSRTLEERRRLIKAYFVGFGKLSATLLSEMIRAYTGSDPFIKFEPFDLQRNNMLYISVSPQDECDFFTGDVIDIVSQKIPAHIPYRLTFEYKVRTTPLYVAPAPSGLYCTMSARVRGKIPPQSGRVAALAGAAAAGVYAQTGAKLRLED
jgi:hypothetical protein